MNSPLIRLSIISLRALSSSLKTGALSHGFSVSAIEQIVGTADEAIIEYFEQLRTDGFSNVQMATLIDTVIETRERTPIPENVFELVLSGPDIPGIHTCDTAATMRSMIRESHQHILMVGYAVHNARELFKPIAEKLETTPGFTARFCLDISRSPGDTSLESEIVHRFTKEFSEKHWPWPTLPELYYDPRSLETGTINGHSSLHAKCIITDHTTAFVTSANFTEAAQFRNIEAGVQIKHVPMVKRLEAYFEGLIELGIVNKCCFY